MAAPPPPDLQGLLCDVGGALADRHVTQETFVYPARHRPTGFRVDFIFSTTEYERQAIGRAVLVDLGSAAFPSRAQKT